MMRGRKWCLDCARVGSSEGCPATGLDERVVDYSAEAADMTDNTVEIGDVVKS